MFVVGLGANLGSREAYLVAALRLLAERVRVVARSRLYVTAPVGPPQPDFLNAAARIETELAPDELLELALDIERRLGRVRRERWGPRTIDLDLLHWSGGAVDAPGLSLPHPRLAERPFALAPLLDVAPELASRYGTIEAPPVRVWLDEGGAPIDSDDALAWAHNRSVPLAPERRLEVARVDGAAALKGAPSDAWIAFERDEADGLRGVALLRARTS
ncbi:MAG: 2-amino-4-hydroxy-6-hydroxymethyldihydropteridine diphosphokinase [Sandaracinaceae bacterium]